MPINFMKKILLLIAPLFIYSFNILAQQDEKKYDSLWKKVEDLSNKKGLTKSALAEVDKIYRLAKKEKKDAQVIKAFLYKMSLNETFDEVYSASIDTLEKEKQTFSEPVTSILNSILAEKYLNYYQQGRYRIYNRTETINFKKDDISTWSTNDFHKKITSLYLASIQNKKLLQQTKLEPFDAIIVKGNARYLRPQLYDLLAHRALDYFRSDERDISKPAYAFEITAENLFLPAESFIKLPIRTNDSLSLHHKALLICKELLAFHAADPRPDALIDADITRIEIIHQYGVMENKEALYAKALENIYLRYPLEPAAARAAGLLARWHANKASTYDPLKDSTNRYEYLEALKICKTIVQQKQESEGKSNCLAIINQIKQKEIILQTEKVNIPDQPFRTLVSFKNFVRLYLRIIPVTNEQQKEISNGYDNNYWKQLIKLTSIRNWNQAFPATNDYQKHSAEIKVDALPVGTYILLASVNEDYSSDKNLLAVQYFYVSNISYINNGNDYFILDRNNGRPLAKAAVQLWNNRYDPGLRKNIFIKGDQLTSDNNGYFHISDNKKTGENFRLEIRYKNDQLFLNDYGYRTYRNENENNTSLSAAEFEKEQARIFFFTDRSIYRPGQTVFFKGIIITEDFNTGKSKLYTNYKSKITLTDPNGVPKDSVGLTSNEFGSYTGSFKIPPQGLNGEFQLSSDGLQGEASFSVEEYKRPKFYADFEKIKSAYRINDSISVTGFAKAYAGNNIDGATVTFRVVRKPRFIYPWLYRQIGIPRSNEMEITNGIITTTTEGKFVIRFKAIPDLSIDKKLEPVFDYEVRADITDINGEVRSAKTTIPVSYKALQLQLSLPGDITIDSLKHISIKTLNLNGEFIPSNVMVSIYTLKSPERLIRQRFWPQPDIFVIGRESYLQLFPYDEYGDETNPEHWIKSEKIYERVDSTKANTSFEITPKGLSTGWYAVEVVTKDLFGEEVKDVRNVQLHDDKNIPSTIYSWSLQKNESVEPGNSSTISIGSAAKDLFVIQAVEKQLNTRDLKSKHTDNQQSVNYKFISLSNEKKSFDFPVTEDDRGGFGVAHFFVKNNRFYVMNDLVLVPWTNKDLTISYESFRDKTLPGSEEKWKVKIGGYKKEMVAAEMLASMYDASLDQFKPHSWKIPDIWPTYYRQYNWNGHNNFSAIQSKETFNEGANNIKFYSNVYDQMISFADRNRILIRGQQSVMAPGIGLYDMVFSKVEVNKATPPTTVKEEDMAHESIAPEQIKNPKKNDTSPTIQTRKKFNETAFFLPDLKTDSGGNISFGFTIPEALTAWKFQALAHTKDAAFGYTTKDIVTQKQLMVQPNAPRFFREGDHVALSAKIVNMTGKELSGTVHLELLNAADMKPVDGWFQNMTANQYFTADAGKSTIANFNIQIPYQYNNAVVYRFTASSDSARFSDGEEASLPVLTNSMLVTESLPLHIQGNTTKKIKFQKLLQSGSSETLQHHSLTVEFSANPAWYAVQALPYLIEYPYECSEQTFNRFYANALAMKIANASPRIKAIFEKWKSSSPPNKENGLLSNLEKNPELKSALLQETPWVLEAKSEAQQKKNIALLFDMVSMNGMLPASVTKLQQLQSVNGGFGWFNGGPDDRFITQYILTGIGHLKKLHALPHSEILDNITRLAIIYLDKRLKEDYDILLKSKSDLHKNNLSYQQVQYLYMRSFFSEYSIPGGTFNAANYYRRQSQQFWLQQNRYMQGMIALALNRSGDRKTAADILKSLQQNAIVHPDMGMYWKENRSGYYWYQAPVETQSLLIEAFSEIGSDNKITDALKTWLLQQKQTQRWSSTKATADACYALLLQGTNWLGNEPSVEIKLGSKTVSASGELQEAGTGYFKTVIDGPFVNPSMGDITVTVASPSPKAEASSGTGNSWGAVYWQYFEKLDKITPAATPLQLVKKLFVEKNTDRGPVLQPVADGASVKVGDKIKVRIELKADRDLEYVQMKDMRAGCMEPVNVISAYKYQGGLGYYESTKDASTSFFFNWLPKGVYVFEYPLFATQAGNFSNGVTTIQCMYAPEFSSHSEGIRVNVE